MMGLLRDSVTRALHDVGAPIPYEAAEWPGASVRSGGTVFRSEQWPQGSGNWQWLSAVEIAEDVAADVARFTSESIEVEVGGAVPGPLNFPTLAGALEYMSKRIPAVAASDINPGFIPFAQGTILIRAGWVAQEQIVIDGGLSMGWVRIISEDAEVTVDEASLTRSEQYYDTLSSIPFILVRNGATSPRIKTKFVCDPDGENRQTAGLYLRSGRYLDDLNRGEEDPLPWAHGFEGFHVNAHIHSGSDAWFTFKSFDDARDSGLLVAHSSRVGNAACRCYGATDGAVRVQTGSILHSHGLIHPSIVGTSTSMARQDPAGLVDSAGDWIVRAGGRLFLVSTTVGGISQAPNVQTVNGFIGDQRSPLITYGGLIKPQPYTVATLPSAAANTGVQVYVTDGAAGAPIMAFSDGTDWLRCDTRAAVTSS